MFSFCRALIEQDLIPDDVTIQVLTQSREHIIAKTFEALKGCKNAIVHLYNSTSVAQREQVFKKSKQEIIDIAVFGAKLCKEYREKTEGNFRFGIGGVVTFKKSIVAQAVAEMELEDIILETDCPYLTPVPYRGRRNESAYVAYVCEKVAEIKGVSAEEVARITTANARRMFLPNE